ncbi:MAG: type I 3-dehydroquinate dehydratase [Planctomycetota bacterium]
MTLACVPIMVADRPSALADAQLAADLGADIVEFRIDELFSGADDPQEEADILAIVAESPLPCIVTCRPTWEGGLYDGPEDARISLYERLGTADSPPAYIDVELKAYTASDNIRQKVNLAVQHPKQQRDVRTRLILSMHDFDGRPSDLTRRLAKARSFDAVSVIKVAYRARSLRDNLELFEILRDADRPTIALGMGEFGLMSRVLAPKFGGFLTFASLRDTSATAPGQPTLRDLLETYRFRAIGNNTKLYGVVGWPVSQSMGPLIHNAGFEAVGHDGVYLPLPIVADPGDMDLTRTSFEATFGALAEADGLHFAGASVTVPFKEHLLRMGDADEAASACGAANTWASGSVTNTDVLGLVEPLEGALGELEAKSIAVVGAGGAGRAAAWVCASRGASVTVYNRDPARAERLAAELRVACALFETLADAEADAFINCTPVGMAGGPDPDGLSIPESAMGNRGTVFFDTVYNPVDTPMIRAARAHTGRVIDGVEMFVRQAAAQFALWTGHPAPRALFDRLVRETLSSQADGA